MRWDIRSVMPQRISGQIVLLIVASVVVIHVVLSIAFFLSRPDRSTEGPPDQLQTLIALIDASPTEARARLVTEMANAFPRFDLALTDKAAGIADHSVDEPRIGELAHHLGPDFHVTDLGAEGPADSAGHLVAVRLRDGQFVTARFISMPRPPFGPFTTTLLATAVSITLLGLWAARGLTRPLRHFAWAAENFSPNGEIALLPERGPYEIRAAARALNQMRERIKSLIDDRTRMLAAVSHDLRTPITRLRLRCEFIKDQAARTKMLDELDHMNSMVESVLHYLRDGQTRKTAIMLDLATSLQAICDQFADVGHDVSYDGPDHVVIRANAEELHRAITNLIDNAIRHGGKTDIRVSLDPSTVTVAIEDDGPGIPDPSKRTMFEPFVRGDRARSMNEKIGFGLGLSIARSVIEAHCGTLTLHDRQPRGLVARVTLPYAGTNGDAVDGDRAH